MGKKYQSEIMALKYIFENYGVNTWIIQFINRHRFGYKLYLGIVIRNG